MLVYVLPILVALTIVTAALGIMRLRSSENKVAKRLASIRGAMWNDEDIGNSISGGKLPFWAQPIRVLAILLPGQALSNVLRWELAGAGFRQNGAASVFVGFRVLTTAALTIGSFIIATKFTELRRNEVLLITIVCAAIGYMLPWILLRMAQNKRKMEITLSLPDALDLMVICVEAGQGLNAALMSVGRETNVHAPALADELKILNLEMSTGVVRSQALRNLALRTNIDDIRALVAVLVQSDKFGTSIGQALRTHAQSLRTRRRQRAEEAARKTPVKMVFPLVFCIFPALLVVILAPGVIELIRALKDVNQ
jgi:tight adherence protein C